MMFEHSKKHETPLMVTPPNPESTTLHQISTSQLLGLETHIPHLISHSALSVPSKGIVLYIHTA